MVDAERVLRLLDRLTRDVATLGRLAPDAAEPTTLDAIKYRFVTAIEGASRVAHHVVVSEGWSAPDSSAAAFTELAVHRVIEADLARDLARAVGFRNVLVHEYAEVDDAKVVAMLDRLGDLSAFVATVGRWVAEQ